MRETDLYQPVKTFLVRQGYDVKGEIADCDVVAVRGDEPPVIVELKRLFSLALVLQGVARQAISDNVYLAIPPLGGRNSRGRLREITGLCRRLGLGLMFVTPDAGLVEIALDPAPYQPRQRRARQVRLLGEFAHRVGDPTAGGGTRRPVVTAYRQDALRCAAMLARNGPAKAVHVAAGTGVPRAAGILYRDVYGWFERVERGIYRLTPKGEEGVLLYADAIEALEAAAPG